MLRFTLTAAFIFSAVLFSCNSADQQKNERDSAAGGLSAKAMDSAIANAPVPSTIKRAAVKADQVTGIWLKMNKDGSVSMEGFQLKPNGNASSLNTPSVRYKGWQHINSEALILDGNKTAGKKDVLFSDTFHIEVLNDTMMRLTKGAVSVAYHKE